MKLIETPISLSELSEIARSRFGDMTKAVIDIHKGIMVVDADLHSDQEQYLIQLGSKQNDLWGINLYPDFFDNDSFIEFDSMINLRPSWGNTTRGVDDLKVQQVIRNCVQKLIVK